MAMRLLKACKTVRGWSPRQHAPKHGTWSLTVNSQRRDPKKSTQNKKVHLNKFFWTISVGFLTRVTGGKAFFGISGFWVGIWASKLRGPRRGGWIRRGWTSRFLGALIVYPEGPKTLYDEYFGTSGLKIGVPQKRKVRPTLLGPLINTTLLLYEVSENYTMFPKVFPKFVSQLVTKFLLLFHGGQKVFPRTFPRFFASDAPSLR